MKYFLSTPSREEAVVITKEDFEKLRCAREILTDARTIEETYDILMSNFIEFESFLLINAVAAATRNEPLYDRVFQLRMDSTRLLINLLTSARMYVDQVPRLARDCGPKGNTWLTDIENLKSAEYKAHVEYRFMEALRNHVQHFGFPVHGTREGFGWTTLDDDGLLEVTIDITTFRSELSSNKKFKNSVLAELEDRVDLRHSTRKYVGSLGSIHEAVRNLTAESVTRSRKEIEGAHNRIGDSSPTTEVALEAIAKSDDGNVAAIPLLLVWDDQRKRLIRRNRTLSNLDKLQFVSRRKPPADG